MKEKFRRALENNDAVLLRNVPKADRHCHSLLGGKIGTAERILGRGLLRAPERMNGIVEMNSYLDEAFSFDLTADLIAVFIEATLLTAKEDGVTVLEASIDCSNMRYYDGGAPEMTRALDAIHQRVAPEIKLIPQLGMIRERDIAELETMSAACIDTGYFRSIDLYSREDAKPPEEFRGIYANARAHGLRLKAHAGEFGGAERVRHTVEALDLDEVMHGIGAAESPDVMAFLAERGTVLHICPTSNIRLGAAGSIPTHPIRALFDAGVRVTVNSDDIIVFGSTVSEEFFKLYREGLFNAGELDTIREWGMEI
ncbi:MAG: adenosine deaminase [Brevinematales bacterium]|nr:adenosine deaminase [Brevinematales bacterium]